MVSVFILARAQDIEIDESLVDKVKQLSEDLLEGYTQPLITAFGTAMGSGLFHTARSHDVLGFDVGLRTMWVQIPSSADYFNATVLACSLDASGDLVTYDVELDSVSTIFGPETETEVPITGNAVGIPPYIPGGFDLPGIPFIIPQVNIGLPFGLEFAFRYIPFAITAPFSYEGIEDVKFYFLGVGGKLGINRLPFFKLAPLPIDIALGGAYQVARVKDAAGQNVVSTNTTNLQILFSKRLIAFEPFFGAGMEWTKVRFHYEFEYEIPDTINNVPQDVIEEVTTIDLTLESQSHYRAMIGFTFYLGPIFIHYDYNITPYKTHNGIIGFTIR